MSADDLKFVKFAAVVLLAIVGLAFGIVSCERSRFPARSDECRRECVALGAPSWSYTERNGCSCAGSTDLQK